MSTNTSLFLLRVRYTTRVAIHPVLTLVIILRCEAERTGERRERTRTHSAVETFLDAKYWRVG